MRSEMQWSPKRRVARRSAARALFACALLCWISACGESSTSTTPASDTLSDGAYTNHYFGFSMKLPEGWSVASRETNDSMRDLGSATLSGGSEAKKAALEEMLKSSYQLLTVSEHAIGSPVDSNPLLQVVAERVSQFPGIRDGSDYLFQVERMLTGSSLPYTAKSKPVPALIDEHEFFQQEYQLASGRQVILQTYLATISKDYALGFILTYTEPEQREALEATLASLRFD